MIRVLLADDTPDLLALLAIQVQQAVDAVGDTLDLRMVGSGTAAVAACENWTPDAVILDQCMPGLSGLDTRSRLWARGIMRVFVLTSHAVSDREREEITLRDLLTPEMMLLWLYPRATAEMVRPDRRPRPGHDTLTDGPSMASMARLAGLLLALLVLSCA